MEQKKYIDITRFKETYATSFTKGEPIVIQEKIDGSNGSIVVDENGNLTAFSRRRGLDLQNTLNGFYNYVQSLDKELFTKVLKKRFIIFGEWMTKHTINYPEDIYHNFYVFDIYDTENNQYVPWYITKTFAAMLNLKTVPVFYEGTFTSWDDIAKYIGRTELGASPCGEGIVVKSQARLRNMNDRYPAYVKIVSQQFSEVHQSKPQKQIDPEKLAAKQKAEELAKTIITERRVEKQLQKFKEDNLIPENWDEHNLGAIAKLMPKAIYEDCVKEEPETVAQIEDFGKICGSITMKIVRGLIK